ncbi:MAG: hypothetical protein HZB39_19710 [Planctomycetes bacterium]|nr:hypothetical protein [Planctomycetota bacterium]
MNFVRNLRSLAVLSCLTLAPITAQSVDGAVDIDAGGTTATWTIDAIGNPGDLAVVLVGLGLDPGGGLVTAYGMLPLDPRAMWPLAVLPLDATGRARTSITLAHRELVAYVQVVFLNPATSSLRLSTDWLAMGHDFAPTDRYRASATRYDSDSNTTRTVIRASRGDRLVLRLTRNGVPTDYYDQPLAHGDETIEVPVTPRPRRGDVIEVIVNGEVVQTLPQ